MPDTSIIPLTWTELFRTLVASSLGYAGASAVEWAKKKRSPAEERKTDAEARQIEAATNLTLMQAAADAITKACRLEDERDHWKRKGESLEKQIELLNVEVNTMDVQMRKLHAFIKLKEWQYSELDKPKE